MVERYWVVSEREQYELLSRTRKERLRKIQAIRNAIDYERATRNPERIWRGREYQEVRASGPGVIRIKVLAMWEQEGYEGVMTFNFVLVREDNSWKIETIIY